MTRFILLEKPLVHPQLDIVNRAPEGPVFDLSVDLNNYDGPIYLRVDHVEEMARQLGYVHPDKYQDLLNEKERLRLKVEMLPDVTELVELKNGIDRYIGAFLTDIDGNPMVRDKPAEDSGKSSEKPAGAARQTDDIIG